MTTVRSFACALLVVASGCSNLLGERPAPPRFFAPVVAAPPSRVTAASPGVRMRPVRAPLHLREAMAWRRADAELGVYEQRRWTELPASYVERTLGDALAAEGVAVVDATGVPVLGVEVLAFEEALAPIHEAVVGFEVTVERAGKTILHRRVTAREPIADDDPANAARAMGKALDEATAQAAGAIARATR